MKNETTTRGPRGRFAPGISGNPEGGRHAARSMSPQRIDRFFERNGAALLDKAFERFQISDEIMSALLIFWGLRSLANAGGSLPTAGVAAQ